MNTSFNSPNSCILPKDSIEFALPVSLTIETIEQVAIELKQLNLTEGADLIINARQLERITTPGLQLLVSLEKTLKSQNGTLSIQNLQHPLKVVFGELGLQSLIAQS